MGRKGGSPSSPSCLAKTREVTSAVNWDRLSGHPSGFLRRKKHNQIRNFIWLTWSSERMRLFGTSEKGPVLCFIHSAPTMKIGNGDARIHGVDAHAVRCHLERGAPRQVIQCGFADAVRQHAGKRSQTVYA